MPNETTYPIVTADDIRNNNLPEGAIITLEHNAPADPNHLIYVRAANIYYKQGGKSDQDRPLYNTTTHIKVRDVAQRILVFVEARNVQKVRVKVSVSAGSFNIEGAQHDTFYFTFQGADLAGTTKMIVVR
jgi:hypothetical protein